MHHLSEWSLSWEHESKTLRVINAIHTWKHNIQRWIHAHANAPAAQLHRINKGTLLRNQFETFGMLNKHSNIIITYGGRVSPRSQQHLFDGGLWGSNRAGSSSTYQSMEMKCLRHWGKVNRPADETMRSFVARDGITTISSFTAKGGDTI